MPLDFKTGKALRQSPALFARTVLGVTPQPWQVEAMDAVRDHPRVCIASGHGVGKSALLSWLCLWHLLTHIPSKTAVTAPTSHQLSDVLFAEITKWARGLPPTFRNSLDIKSDTIRLRGAPDTAIYARTSRLDNPTALQGFHDSNSMLFLCDEAAGIPDAIYEVASGALSSKGSRIILAGNPTSQSGYFYNAFHRNRARWKTMNVSCLDSPMVSPEWVQTMADDYGEDSAVYAIRVLGKFASQQDNAIINADLVTSAWDRDIIEDPEAPEIWGLDVARSGSDSCALVKRRGAVVTGIKVWQSADLMATCGLVMAELEALPPSKQPTEILVDSIGIGAGVCDRLAELAPTSVRGINVAESQSMKSGRFKRLRDELWWKTREWLEGKDVRLPQDDRLLAELTAPQYTIMSDGRIQAESKDSMKRRGVRSPDSADALALTFASAATTASGGTRGYMSSWNKPLKQPTVNWVV
jgi:phage terminase large subunit